MKLRNPESANRRILLRFERVVRFSVVDDVADAVHNILQNRCGGEDDHAVGGYLLVRQNRSDKSSFLESGGFTALNPDALVAELGTLCDQGDAQQVDENKFGRYYELSGVLRGPLGIGLRVKTIWMTEHLSGSTKFVTLIPIELVHP